jgi:hypothetical protein
MARRKLAVQPDPAEPLDENDIVPELAPQPTRQPKALSRSAELSKTPGVASVVTEAMDDVVQGFLDQRQRSDDNMDYWDAYNSKLGERQFYNGNSRIFVPIIRNAVKARKTRFVNQVFPVAGRYVDCVTETGDLPYAQMSLLEHYVLKAKLRTQVLPALMVAGDVEGQYTLYIDWREKKRQVVQKVQKPIQVELAEGDEPMEMDETVDDVESVDVYDCRPTVEVVTDADFLVLPATVDSLEEAIDCGGSVTVIRRWSKSKLRKMIRDGDVDKLVAEALIKGMGRGAVDSKKDSRVEQAEAAGIKSDNGSVYCLGYETWMNLTVQGQERLCRVLYAGEGRILSVKRCPYWNDKLPIISAPVEKAPGVFKGRSPLADVIDTQVLANDAVNEGADTAHFSAMPIIMTDPDKNPRVGSMILSLAAVWETNPRDTQFAQFPQLWKDSFTLVAACKAEIFQTLGVNPSMIPQSTGGDSKRNQAEIANEQQVDVLTTADAVWNIEEAILTPMLQLFADYDHQFRDDDLLVKTYGDVGLKARMEEIPPQQDGNRWQYRWFGVEASRNAQQVQQQISFLNVLGQTPPAAYPGYKLNMAPVLVHAVENVFGPRLAPLVFEDMRDQQSVPPEVENDMLHMTLPVAVHQLDNDAEHLQAHMQLLGQQMGGGDPGMVDPSGVIRQHIAEHQQQIQMKSAAAQQQATGMAGGPPGGGGQGPQGPQPGAMVGPPHAPKQPPGAVHPDQMGAHGAVVMPRSM